MRIYEKLANLSNWGDLITDNKTNLATYIHISSIVAVLSITWRSANFCLHSIEEEIYFSKQKQCTTGCLS